MNETLVSCIIPAYNHEAFIREAIDSVLAQTRPVPDIVVVDDGSTDATASVVRSYGPRVRYVWQENAGPAAARNRGLAEASGHLFAFLDADDLWLPERMERQLAPLEADPALSFTVCQLQNFWVPELEAEAQVRRQRREGQAAAGYVSGGLVARREAFERVGPFDPALGHGDSADWFLRARAAGLVGILVPQVLVLRRIHPGNRSRAQADASRDEFLHLLKRQIDARRGSQPGDGTR